MGLRGLNWLPVAFALVLLVLWLATSQRPPWGDEGRYLHNVRLFGQGLSLSLLKTYFDLTPPLMYLTYASWGHIAGFDTPNLRLLSVALGGAATWLMFAVCLNSSSRRYWSVACWAAVCFNPYFIGVAIFVFTDMLMIAALLAGLVALRHRRYAMATCALAAAVMTRQYAAFFVLAVVAAALLERSGRAWAPNLRLAAWATVSIAPLLGLFLFWGGLGPQTPLRQRYLTHAVGYDMHALSMYLAAPGIYLAPLAIWAASRGVKPAALLIGVMGALLVLVFPVQPSAVQILEGIGTVGLFDRVARPFLPDVMLRATYCLFAALWLSVFAQGTIVLRASVRGRPVHAHELVCWTCVVSFYLLMPFSYMAWEKYALPLVVFAAAFLCQAFGGPPVGRTTQRATTSNNRSEPRSSTVA